MIAAARQDRGNATVEFALVTPLLLAVALGVLQVILVLYVRATTVTAAAEGARAAALAGASAVAGEQRTRALLDADLSGSTVRDVRVKREIDGGIPVITVSVDSVLPLLGLLGPTAMHVEGHALLEAA